MSPLVENDLVKASHRSSQDLRRETEEGMSTREPGSFGAISAQTHITIIISEHCLLQESPFLNSAHYVGPCVPLSNELLILTACLMSSLVTGRTLQSPCLVPALGLLSCTTLVARSGSFLSFPSFAVS